MATKEELHKAIKAVDNGVASKEQERLAAAAAKQAGSTGNLARKAFE